MHRYQGTRFAIDRKDSIFPFVGNFPVFAPYNFPETLHQSLFQDIFPVYRRADAMHSFESSVERIEIFIPHLIGYVLNR